MLRNWVLIFRDSSTGELEPVKVKAGSREAAVERGLVEMNEKYGRRAVLDAWELIRVRRTEP